MSPHAVLSPTLGIIGAVSVGAAYLTPAVISVARRVPRRGPLIALNILIGWPLVGWVAAFALSLRGPVPPDQETAVLPYDVPASHHPSGEETPPQSPAVRHPDGD